MAPSRVSQQPNTRLYAEKSTADDILNSPDFLKRKIDVLTSDVAAVDEKIEAANKVYEDNKAEWGPQLENLRKEVRSWINF